MFICFHSHSALSLSVSRASHCLTVHPPNTSMYSFRLSDGLAGWPVQQQQQQHHQRSVQVALHLSWFLSLIERATLSGRVSPSVGATVCYLSSPTSFIRAESNLLFVLSTVWSVWVVGRALTHTHSQSEMLLVACRHRRRSDFPSAWTFARKWIKDDVPNKRAPLSRCRYFCCFDTNACNCLALVLILPFVCSPFFPVHTPSAVFFLCRILHLFPLFPLLPFTWSVASSSLAVCLLSPPLLQHPPVDANPNAYIFFKWLHLRIDAQMRTKFALKVWQRVHSLPSDLSTYPPALKTHTHTHLMMPRWALRILCINRMQCAE